MGKDMVNHPAHYADSCSMECFDAMKIAFGMDNVLKYCEITAFKYLWRHKSKGGEEDVRKALWYLERAKELIEKEYAVLYDDQLHALLIQAQVELDKYGGKVK
jgi:Cdc6-like AAA superfamily ATPase